MEDILLCGVFLMFCILCVWSYFDIFPVLFLATNRKKDFGFHRMQTDLIKGIAILGIFISHIATHSSYLTGGGYNGVC